MANDIKTIAIIEDDPSNYRLYKKYLDMSGDYDISPFKSHDEFSAVSDTVKFDLIISDDFIQKQNYGVLEWSRSLRDGDSINKDTPLLVLGSSGITATQAVEAGIQTIHEKPISLQQFTDSARVLLHMAELKASVAAETLKTEVQPMPDTKPVIAVIEDEPLLQRMYKRVLENHSTPHVFSNHTDADAWLKDNKPDLILTDERIAGQDFTGVEWVKERRKVDQKIPIVVISATAETEEVLAAGAQEFLEKPFHKETLIALVEKYTSSTISPHDLTNATRDGDKERGR